MKINKQKLLAGAAGAVLTLGLGAGALAFADTPVASTSTSQPASMHQPGVGGTVTAVSGNTITVTGKDGTSYTIDASAAAITKDETVAVADVAVGDTITADGTVNGTSVTATNIHDGKMTAGGFGGRGPDGMGRGCDHLKPANRLARNSGRSRLADFKTRIWCHPRTRTTPATSRRTDIVIGQPNAPPIRN